MIGATAVIFLLIPETPWWLASKGKIDQTANVLQRCNGKVEGYDIQEQIVSDIHLLYIQISVFGLTGPGDHDCHHPRGATNRKGKRTRRTVVCLLRPQLHPIHHRRVAEDHSAVCRSNRVQHLCYILL